MKKLSYLTLFVIVLLGVGACNKEKNLTLVNPPIILNKILFSASDSGFDHNHNQIFVMNDDSSGLTQLTFNGQDGLQEQSYDAKWSIDGNKIVFLSGNSDIDYPTNDIYIMNSDGSNKIRLTNDGRFKLNPSFSPSGDKIMFSQSLTDIGLFQKEIFTISTDGTNIIQLTSFDNTVAPAPDAATYDACYTPDGSKIIFASNYASLDEQSVNIFSMDSDGSNVEVITNGEIYGIHDIQLSPDGNKVLFITANSSTIPSHDIYTMNIDGSALTQVTHIVPPVNMWDHYDVILSANWSPDGSKIIYGSNLNVWGYDDIYVMNADGSNPYKFKYVHQHIGAIQWR